MRANKQLLLALLMAVISGVIVLGSLSISFFESGYALVDGPGNLPIALIPGEQYITLAAEAGSGGSEVIGTVVGPTAAVIPGQILPPTPTIFVCPRPAGWQMIVLRPEDTLPSLAHAYDTSVAMLKQSNCLVIDQLVAGSELSVPALPAGRLTPTRASVASCSPPANWVHYIVRVGDTLYSLAVRLGYSVYQLQSGNCLSTTAIYAGQALRLPYYPPALATPTRGPIITVGVPSSTPFLPTVTRTIIPVPPFTPTRTSPPVWTATNTPQPTATHTDVPAPSSTPVTPPPTPSNTPVTPPPTPSNTPVTPPPVIVDPPTSTPVPPPPPPEPPTATPAGVYPFP